jgi:predicted Zn-dependent protease
MNRRGAISWVAALAMLATAAASGADAKPVKLSAPKMPSFLPGGGYAVDGRKGKFIIQVAGRPFSGAVGKDQALAFGSEAMNRGELKGAILAMPQTEAQLRLIVTKLDANWPYAKPTAVAIHLVGLPDYFAEALPDGSMMVHMGLLEHAKSDDEVAFILAHELSHVRLAHFVNASGFQKQRQALTLAAQVFTAGAAISQIKAANTGAGLSLTLDPNNPTLVRTVNKAAVINDDVHLLLNVFIEPAWSRAQEDEADAMGYDLATAAGYSADSASSRVFDSIQADFDARQATVQALQQQAKETISLGMNEVSKSLLTNGSPSLSLTSLGQDLETGVGEKAFTIVTGFWSQKHRNPQARRKGLGDYSSRSYPDGGSLTEEQHGWLDQTRARREFVEASTTTDSVATARALSDQAKFDEAAKALAPALKTTFSGSTLVLNVQAGIFRGKGDVVRADQTYAKVEARGDQSIDGYLDHVEMLIGAKRYDRASQVINGAMARLNNDDKPFLPALITISMQTGKQQEGINYLSQCIGYSDPGLTQECSDAASGLTEDQRKKLTPDQQAQLDRLRRTASEKLAVSPNPLAALLALKPPAQ